MLEKEKVCVGFEFEIANWKEGMVAEPPSILPQA